MFRAKEEEESREREIEISNAAEAAVRSERSSLFPPLTLSLSLEDASRRASYIIHAPIIEPVREARSISAQHRGEVRVP